MMDVNYAISTAREFLKEAFAFSSPVTTSSVIKSVHYSNFESKEQIAHGQMVVATVANELFKDSRLLQRRVAPFRFEFGIPSEMEDFGRDLCRNGVLPMPFTACLFDYPEMTCKFDGSVVDEGFRSATLVVDVTGKVPIAANGTFDQKTSDPYLLLVGFFGNPEGNKWLLDTFALMNVRNAIDGETVGLMPIILYNVYKDIAKAKGRPFPVGAEHEECWMRDMFTTAHRFFGCLGSLLSKSVVKTEPTEQEIKKSLRHPLEKRQIGRAHV